MASTDTDSLGNLPPSAKLVYKVLEYNDELTQQQISESSRLPPRTVRGALGSLESAGLIEKRWRVSDARVRLYRIRPADESNSP